MSNEKVFQMKLQKVYPLLVAKAEKRPGSRGEVDGGRLLAHRYSQEQLAPHVVGYLDSLGGGAAGIELAMDDVLSQCGGEISVTYRVDAVGRVLAGEEPQVVNTLEESAAGGGPHPGRDPPGPKPGRVGRRRYPGVLLRGRSQYWRDHLMDNLIHYMPAANQVSAPAAVNPKTAKPCRWARTGSLPARSSRR